jgi:two-component sensor histidine kinase
MSTIDLFDEYGFGRDEIEHLVKLRQSWNLFADLSFADLIMFIPSINEKDKYIVVGQIRPSTAQTLYVQDLVGVVIDKSKIPLVDQAFFTGEIGKGLSSVTDLSESVLETVIPVNKNSKTIAVVDQVRIADFRRHLGQLEKAYSDLANAIANMIVEGTFPYEDTIFFVDDNPRVGDGVLIYDSNCEVTFASPNAVSILHRIGIHISATGHSIKELDLSEDTVLKSFETKVPIVEESERGNDLILLTESYPLIEQEKIIGGFMLIRDVSELRKKDRLLLTKDAAIREVHHRVKNNLQTISSLLRLQTRRVNDSEAKGALSEAERRIRSIAIVHEMLSRDSSNQVPFNEIIDLLVKFARDTAVNDTDISFEVNLASGAVIAEVATPLAVAISELIQNALEHAFVDNPTNTPKIKVGLKYVKDNLEVTVSDNGQGLPKDFSIEKSNSLGLLLVRDLIKNQLDGELVLESTNGTQAKITVPISAIKSISTIE